MRKATTMPTTARERATRLEPLPLLRRLRTAATLNRQQTTASDPLGVTGLALLSSFGRDSSPQVAPWPRRALTTASSSVVDHLRDGDVVHAGWLSVEHQRKRGFRWRFCVLDGALLSCYDGDQPGASVVREHEIAAVERLPQLNRALVLVGADGYRLWLHVDHDESNYEQWLRLFAAAADRRARRRDGSIFLRKPLQQMSSQPAVGAFTGWIPRVRRTRLALSWLWSRPQRMYCALQGRTFAGFVVNAEGRWADLLGVVRHVTTVESDGQPRCIELRFSNTRAVVRLQPATPAATSQWLERLELAASDSDRHHVE